MLNAEAVRRSAREVGGVLSGRRRIAYPWVLLVCAVASVAVGGGVGFWSYGLYVQPLEDEFGWTRAGVTLGWSITLAAGGLAGPFVGRWIDRYGARRVLIAGTVLTVLSYLALAGVQNAWQWYAVSAVHGVVRQIMIFMPFMTLITRWFDERRGLATSILGMGFSLGGFTVLPGMAYVVDSFGWRAGFLASGLAITLVYLPVGLFVLRDPPRAAASVDGTPSEDGMTVRAALRTPLFWAITMGLSAFFFGFFGWLVHQVPFYESTGISASGAAEIVAISAALTMVARLGAGLVADRFGRFEPIAAVMAVAGALGLIVLFLDTSPVAIALFLIFWTVGGSGGPMVEALLLTRAFGVAHFASILGTVIVIETVTQILSPTVAGAIYDATGSYDAALLLFTATSLIAAALFVLAGRMPHWADRKV